MTLEDASLGTYAAPSKSLAANSLFPSALRASAMLVILFVSKSRFNFDCADAELKCDDQNYRLSIGGLLW
jgi:hypothetical protein